MKTIRRAAERGRGDHGWLKTHHTFSFGDYFSSEFTQFRSLRVMNEDWIAPGQGFGRHPHRDMEIVTIVLQGALEHRDSLGNGQVLRPGEVQRMTAGRGIEHSEFNPSSSEPTHLYQIWLLPERRGLPPGYEQKPFAREARVDRWQLIASPDGHDDSVTIRQDARLWLAAPTACRRLEYDLAPGRSAWLQVLSGDVSVGELTLAAGDGLAVSDESQLAIVANADSELLLFDLA